MNIAVAAAAGELVPKAYHGVLHPVLVTAVIANAGAALQGKLMGASYTKAQQIYLAKVGLATRGCSAALCPLLMSLNNRQLCR